MPGWRAQARWHCSAVSTNPCVVRVQSAGVPDNYVTTSLANSQGQSGRRRLAQQPAPAPQPGGGGGSASNLAVNSQARQAYEAVQLLLLQFWGHEHER